MDENAIICKICGKEFKSLMSLSRHLRFDSISSKDYYDKYFKTENEGKCLCCNKSTKFINIKLGYQKTCSNECAIKSGFRGNAISQNKQHSDILNYSIYITEKTDLKNYNGKQKVKFNCINCNNECNSCVQTIRSKKFNQEFLCQRCKKLIHNNKAYKPNERILIDENTDLSKYITKQQVKYYCTICNALQNTSILYMRQNRNKDKFLCQSCTYKKYIETNYNISVPEFQNKLFKSYYSKISYKLFESLNQTDVYYGDNEFGLYDKENNCYYKYDFTIPKLKKIIEFNGDYWHPKSLHDMNFNPFTGQTSEEAWLKDRQKEKCAVDKGYKIFYIWEYEVLEDFDKAVLKCLEFLKEE